MTLNDVRFAGLPDVVVGQHLWNVTKAGSEPHELGLRALDEGVTAEMVAEMRAGGGGVPPSSPR